MHHFINESAGLPASRRGPALLHGVISMSDQDASTGASSTSAGPSTPAPHSSQNVNLDQLDTVGGDAR